MSFVWPTMLFSLLLIPAFVAFYVQMQRRRRQLAASYGSLGPGQEMRGSRPSWHRHLPAGTLTLGLTLMLFALARPQMVVNVPRIQGTVILAFDVSGSMAADDLQPTRLQAAQTAAIEFVQRKPRNVEIGVVAFSDNGFRVQTPTVEEDVVLATINRLKPERGTSVANGIIASLDTIFADQAEEAAPGPGRYTDLTPAPTPTASSVPPGITTPTVIVLLTDGENNESPDPLEAAEVAADRGVRIYTIGVGTSAGTTLSVNGFLVHTQLNEAILQQISQITGGTYFGAESEQDLHTIYEQINRQLVIKPEEMEITSILAGASILTLLIGATLSLLWFGRVP